MFAIDNFQICVSHAILAKKLNQKTITRLVNSLIKEENKLKGQSLFIIDAESIAGLKHLQACIHFGIKSFKLKENIARSLNAEILLYISGYRQISKAIEQVGLSISSKEIIMVQMIESPNSQIIDEKSLLFEYDIFLKMLDIGIEFYKTDISEFFPKNLNKVMKNLEINDEIISIYINPNNPDYTKENITEKLAIEKSAQLNLIK
ncbi:MAG: hypothetical protein FK731_10305 [Asgard group archaeon]|nr:hypothetical protein [Asgard group archaeon]